MHNTWHLKPEHSFTKLWLEPYCTELRNMCKRQKFMFLEKRSYLLKFLDLFDGLGKYKYSPILILYQNFLVNTLIRKMNKVPKCCISWGTTRSGMNDEDWHIYKKLLSCNTLAAMLQYAGTAAVSGSQCMADSSIIQMCQTSMLQLDLVVELEVSLVLSCFLFIL